MNRIAELRKKAKLTQTKLAQALGVAQNTVCKWENGYNEPDMKTLLRLSDMFAVSVDYIIGAGLNPESVRIPVLGDVQAGFPAEAVEDIDDYEEIPLWMSKQGDHFALRIRGDSMEPRMLQGDIVIVRRQPDVTNGDVAVIMISDESATVKKVIKSRTGINLVAYNQNYPIMEYSNQEIEEMPVRILGKVVELRGKY